MHAFDVGNLKSDAPSDGTGEASSGDTLQPGCAGSNLSVSKKNTAHDTHYLFLFLNYHR